MQTPVVVIGIGEIGSVLARASLRAGHPVFPVTRRTDVREMAEIVPTPLAAIVAVGERDLPPVLASLPAPWRDRVVLLQNELLPRDWAGHELHEPTILSVWFEKKPGMDSRVVVPSVAFGPRAPFLRDALAGLGLPVEVLADEERLLFELVRKNLYILTTNIAGLVTGGTVQTLWSEHRELAGRVAREVLAIQAALTGRTLDEAALIDAMVTAFEGDPAHRCTGRSAPARLQRALQQARAHGIAVPTLEDIARRTQGAD